MDSSALSSAESWLSIIGTVKLVAAFLVAIGVAFEFGGDWIAKPYEKTVADARKLELAKLEAAADEAKKDVAEANATAAQANERAAKLQEAAAWRILPPDVKNHLIAALKTGIGGSIELSYSVNDPESLFLASQFEAIFKQVSEGRTVPLWNVKNQPRQFSQVVYWGIHIVGERADLVASLGAAFAVAGVSYSNEPVSYVLNDAPGLTISGNPPDAMIFVGSKRPPI